MRLNVISSLNSLISLPVKKFSYNRTRFCLGLSSILGNVFIFNATMKCLSCYFAFMIDYPPFFTPSPQKKSKRKIYYYTVLCLCVYLIHIHGPQFAAVNDNNDIITVSIQITCLYSVIVTDCLNCVQNGEYFKQAIKLKSTYTVIEHIKK